MGENVMAEPALPPGFVLEDAPKLTKADYRAKLQQMVDAGATGDQIKEYVRSTGADPDKITGLNEALAYRDKGGKGVGVAVQGEPPLPDGFVLEEQPREKMDSSTAGRYGAADAGFGWLDEAGAVVDAALPRNPFTTKGAKSAWETGDLMGAIKGNITSNGHIYHMPWSAWYDRVKIDEKRGERWFCSEAEATAAGWRPAAAH